MKHPHAMTIRPNGYTHRLLAELAKRTAAKLNDPALDSPKLTDELRRCGEIEVCPETARHRLTKSGKATLALLDGGSTVEVKRYGGGS